MINTKPKVSNVTDSLVLQCNVNCNFSIVYLYFAHTLPVVDVYCTCSGWRCVGSNWCEHTTTCTSSSGILEKTNITSIIIREAVVWQQQSVYTKTSLSAVNSKEFYCRYTACQWYVQAIFIHEIVLLFTWACQQNLKVDGNHSTKLTNH